MMRQGKRSVGRALALGAWLCWASVAAAKPSPPEQEPICREDCISARAKCSEVCRTHAKKGENICIRACGEMEQECRRACQAPQDANDDE